MEALGSPRLWRSPNMKNFARLVRFAWPYRVRFGLSMVCAALVALLWVANISAVLPLLKILFYENENCQKWVAEKIVTLEADVETLDIRLAEIDFISRAGDPTKGVLQAHFKQIHADRHAKHEEVNKVERDLTYRRRASTTSGAPHERAELDALRHKLLLAEARLDELNRYRTQLSQDVHATSLDHRSDTLKRHAPRRRVWISRLSHRSSPGSTATCPSEGFQTLLLLIGLVMTGVAVKGFFLFMQEVLVADVMQLTLFDIRNYFYRRTMALDLSNFGDQGSAELISRFTNDMDSLSQGLNTLMGKVIREPLRAISCLGFAVWLNWRLTFLALILVPVSALTANRAGQDHEAGRSPLAREHVEHLQDLAGDLPGHRRRQGLHDGAERAAAVLPRDQESLQEERQGRHDRRPLRPRARDPGPFDRLHRPAGRLLSRPQANDLPRPGYPQAATGITANGHRRPALPLRHAGRDLRPRAEAGQRPLPHPARRAAADRICALMDRRPQVADRPASTRLPRHRGLVEFDEVGFSYNGRDTSPPRPVALRPPRRDHRPGRPQRLRQVDPHEPAPAVLGRRVGCRSGSTATTSATSSSVALRGQIGMVIQETILFEDTIANNIAYGNRHATRDAIIAAARRSYAHQFITALARRLRHVIGERGLGLSGGQRQRIALARAMLRDPAILILDEATSAVDIQDEALIRKAIEEFARNRTTFLITHSLGALQFADRIVLMNAGRIEAVGTDSELRRGSPLYRRLHEIHFQRESA